MSSLVGLASAHYGDARIEIFKAITTPIIDGRYNTTLQKADNDGVGKLVDEWNDASWIEVPMSTGDSLSAYSAYKYVTNDKERALYVASDFVTAISLVGNIGAVTLFDPRHDGGVLSNVDDDFKIRYQLSEGTGSFQVGYSYVEVRSPSSKSLRTSRP
jgi:hypothetical protein